MAGKMDKRERRFSKVQEKFHPAFRGFTLPQREHTKQHMPERKVSK